MDAYNTAMRILAVRFNSEAELRRKLRTKKFEKEEIDATIARLHAEKWIDDERFAGAFVRARQNKRVGRLRIRRELQAAGVSDEAAGKAVSDHADPERERESLDALCAKKARALLRRHGEDYLSTQEGKSKLATYLVAQGYDSSLVWEVVRAVSSQLAARSSKD